MFRIIIYILVFVFQLNGLLYSQKDIQTQLKNIDAISNDSLAFETLQTALQNKSLTIKQQLNFKFRIVSRAYYLRKYSIAIETANACAPIAARNGLDSLEAVFYKFIGVTNYLMDRKRDAVPYYEKALKIAHENDLWELEASCYNNIGGTLCDVQEYIKAEPYLLKAISIMTLKGQENSPLTLRSYRVLARLFQESGREEKAEPLYLKLIEKGKVLKDTAFICNNLIFYSELLAKRGEVEKAIEMSKQVLAFRRKQKDLHDLINALNIHKYNLVKGGQYKEAYDLGDEETYLMRNIFKKDLEKEISEVEVKYKTAQIQQEKELAELKTKKQKQIYLFSFLGVFVLAGSGFYVWSQRKKAKHLTELAEIEKSRFKDVIDAEEKERSRIAQELHDGLGQLLSTARLNVAGLEDAVSAEDKAGVERSLKIIDDACVEVRSISHNMMPSALIRLGLIPAINELVNNVNLAKGIKIDFTTNVEDSFGKSLDITIYRVVQEILNNMIRHAKANHINMSIEKSDDNLKITMQDNGIGFNPEELKNSKGIGWKNIFSRVSMLDGDIKLESELQKGTIVFINLKLSRRGANAKNG
ncbi:MAG: sensor histidine kinase [Bacteroidia bacterium]|nr:sensor histidine kinase [Bacteroidia bacterium]